MSTEMSDEVDVYIVERDGDPPSQRLIMASVNDEKAYEAFEQGGADLPEADILIYMLELPTKTVKDQVSEVFVLTQTETPDIDYAIGYFAIR